VVAFEPGARPRQPGYRGTGRRWHALAWRVAPAAVLPAALALAGCSFSYQLDSLFDRKGDAELTSSLRQLPKVAAEPPAEGDLAIARAAVSEVLSKGGKDASMPWENPSTGARGTVTPLAAAYDQDGVTCRDFLASYVKNGNEAWLQGEACRARHGKWEVRALRPMNSKT
jgi:17 kDa outer membrane surface antigen